MFNQNINNCKYFDNNVSFVAYIDNKIVGFLLGKVYDNNPLILTSWDYKIRFKDNQQSLWENNVRYLIEKGIQVQPIVCLTNLLIENLKPEDIFLYFKRFNIKRFNFERITNTGNALVNNLRPTNENLQNWLLDAYKIYEKQKMVDMLIEIVDSRAPLSSRNPELVNINIKDITFSESKLNVIGKGNKERTIYLNKACMNAIKDYIENSRPKEGIKYDSKDALFLSKRRERISNRTVQYIVKRELQKAGLDTTKYSVHKLRHTAATLMYQYGNIDIRALQELLGHSDVCTTQLYTHISKKRLKDIYFSIKSDKIVTNVPIIKIYTGIFIFPKPCNIAFIVGFALPIKYSVSGFCFPLKYTNPVSFRV